LDIVKKIWPLLENASPLLVSQAGYGPALDPAIASGLPTSIMFYLPGSNFWLRHCSHLATCLATANDSCVVLILLLNCKLIDSSCEPRKDKLGMVSEIFN